jgi:hypothetical protein
MKPVLPKFKPPVIEQLFGEEKNLPVFIIFNPPLTTNWLRNQFLIKRSKVRAAAILQKAIWF